MKYKIETYIDEKGIEHIKIPQKLLQDKARNGGMIYLGEFLDYLPHNSFIWKSVTGCGATTLALNDNSNCIIALPTRQTVQSKWVKRDKENNIIGYDTEILCVYGGLNNKPEAIAKYIEKRTSEDAPVKIVCTYDQVEFIVMTMTGKRWEKGEYIQSQSKDAMCFSFDTYRLYIDEVHQVLDDYADRDRRERINGMLKCLKMFNDVTCITATPLEMDEIMDEFKHLPIVKIDFPAMEVRKEDIKTRYPAETCTKIVKDYLDGVNFGNAHIFVNSVDFILKVVSNVAKDRNMTTGQIYDSIKIVCGDTELNKGKILNRITKLSDERIMKNITKENLALEMDEILINGLKELEKYKKAPIGSINSPVKKINFYTSTAFMGADVFDKDGQIFVVTDDMKPNTTIDISTSFVQIIGRIRDYQSDKIIYIYSKNRYISEEKSKAQFLLDQQRRAKFREEWEQTFNTMTFENFVDGARIPELETIGYLNLDKKTKTLTYDKYLQWHDERNFRIAHLQSGKINSPLIRSDKHDVIIKTVSSEEDVQPLEEQIKRKANKRTTFQALFNRYIQLKDSLTLFPDLPNRISYLEMYEPLLYDAYTLLGETRVKELQYKRREIEREVGIRKNIMQRKKIFRLLNLKIGDVYTASELDTICTNVQNKLHLTKPLRISDYYETTNTTKRVEGKITKARRIKSKIQ